MQNEAPIQSIEITLNNLLIQKNCGNMKQTTSLQIIHSALNSKLIIYLFTLILDCYNTHEAFFVGWHTRCNMLFSKLLISSFKMTKGNRRRCCTSTRFITAPLHQVRRTNVSGAFWLQIHRPDKTSAAGCPTFPDCSKTPLNNPGFGSEQCPTGARFHG